MINPLYYVKTNWNCVYIYKLCYRSLRTPDIPIRTLIRILGTNWPLLFQAILGLGHDHKQFYYYKLNITTDAQKDEQPHILELLKQVEYCHTLTAPSPTRLINWHELTRRF